jgi:hypothetical protein
MSGNRVTATSGSGRHLHLPCTIRLSRVAGTFAHPAPARPGRSSPA